MARPPSLSRDRIVAAAVGVIEAEGAERLTVRRLGEVLGVDPTSMYRHFRNMGELERAVGDRFLDGIDVVGHENEPWQEAIVRICTDLRGALMAQPQLARYAQAAPPRLVNELRITEALLGQLGRAGYSLPEAARAYHALIELTIGSAAVDAPMSAEAAGCRDAAYASWRSDYAALDADAYPASVAVAEFLYLGTADDRFAFTLRALLVGLRGSAT